MKNYKKKIYEATKKPFKTNSAMEKKRIDRIFKNTEIKKNKAILETQEKHLDLFFR